ncbi:MAG: hypothetical protein HYR70_04440 [Chloroflexi bacterium]|nr:hypothetical protein [Chloroflexota bacterium]MBI3340805.1 hypothetical protein [Chloroflexota bacterium]
MFKNFFLKISGGYLSELEQDKLIKYVLIEARKYPQVAREVRLFLDGQSEDLSPNATGVLRAIAYQWLMDRRK